MHKSNSVPSLVSEFEEIEYVPSDSDLSEDFEQACHREIAAAADVSGGDTGVEAFQKPVDMEDTNLPTPAKDAQPEVASVSDTTTPARQEPVLDREFREIEQTVSRAAKDVQEVSLCGYSLPLPCTCNVHVAAQVAAATSYSLSARVHSWTIVSSCGSMS